MVVEVKRWVGEFANLPQPTVPFRWVRTTMEDCMDHPPAPGFPACKPLTYLVDLDFTGPT